MSRSIDWASPPVVAALTLFCTSAAIAGVVAIVIAIDEMDSTPNTPRVSTASTAPGVESERRTTGGSSAAGKMEGSSITIDILDPLEKVFRNCNVWERLLWYNLIQPKNIKTTLETVYASTNTVETLRSLASLVLFRPYEFSYGILADSTAPALLLYGPPGTGKTHLVKAIAKECDATVLSISGADMYQTYIGESEKVVRAMFTLARKVAPCIIFVDEADAIFRARGSDDKHWYRSIMMQFMQEWDGFSTDTEQWVLVVLATNRPYDLDEAVLRRLPKKILFDLPSTRGREKILRIHLKDEHLHEDVDLPALASSTNNFSGSDLKSVCVAAAYTCIYDDVKHSKGKSSAADEGAVDEDATDEVPDPVPPRRILRMRHFEKALSEIFPSVDPDSLSKIRNFQNTEPDDLTMIQNSLATAAAEALYHEREKKLKRIKDAFDKH